MTRLLAFLASDDLAFALTGALLLLALSQGAWAVAGAVL